MQASIFFIAFLIAFSFPSSVLCRNLASTSSDGKPLQTYIVHVQPRIENVDTANLVDLESLHRSFLPQTSPTVDSEDSSDRLVYSYSEVFSGFAARLTEEELEEISKKQGFIHAYPDRMVPLLTTHTPEFLGLTVTDFSGVWNRSSLGQGVIIGVLDSGILPGHPSFNDDGVPPPPARWKGKCLFDSRTAGCNNKVIGAETFITVNSTKGSTDPTDYDGHGSHIASTIAGNFVKNVDAFGLGDGTTAAGMAPHAHLAIYKACVGLACGLGDVLAALDAAVKDGVDVLSLSLGGGSVAYSEDLVAIGSFAAIEKGITVVGAAGNFGPAQRSLSNEAPWILTVGASSIDRSFRSTVRLGDGNEYNGETLFQPANFSSKPFPLIYSSVCSEVDYAESKIVSCEQIPRDAAVKASGVILMNLEREGYNIVAYDLPLPGSAVSFADGLKIKEYMNSTKNPTASLFFHGTVLGTSPAPVVAFFSSRGPNLQSPGILKPDISAPGLNILAAWNTKVDLRSDYKVPFNIIFGTSMAVPHISGVAALIKSLHPDWSPAAIKSAIITSSDAQDRDGNPIKDEQKNNASFFALGAGHVNPSKAAEPGLVYDLAIEDYIAHLCSAMKDREVSLIARMNITCSRVKQITDSELNYPTITVSPSSGSAVTVSRTVTNVGNATNKYTVEVDVPKGVTVTVNPKTLQFSKVNEKQTFSVTITASSAAQGNLKWVSGNTVVRSALVVTA